MMIVQVVDDKLVQSRGGGGERSNNILFGAGVAVEPENELATYTRHTLTKPRTTFLFPFFYK